MHGVALPVPGGFSLAVTDRHYGVAAIFRSVETIAAGLINAEGLIGSVDFEHIVAVEIPNADIDASRTELNLDCAVVKIEKRESSIWCEIDRRRSQLHLGTRIAIGPELVAGCHRTIGNCFDPLGFSGRLKRDRAIHVSQARYAAWRIVLILRRQWYCNGAARNSVGPSKPGISR